MEGMETFWSYGTVTRSHYCGTVTEAHIGEKVTITGWVHNWRNLGNLLFIDVRDYRGIVQTVFSSDASNECLEAASKLRNEFVVGITGTVRPRPDGMINPDMKTGAIEILVESLTILNSSLTPPFPVAQSTSVNEELRMQYRYIDVRSERMQRNLRMRNTATQSVRKFLTSKGFIEVETPILMKSTPEGARDFIVPSRLHPGSFYALPQSPQLYKQMLMMSGIDRYFQLARCFRDEDSRGDKQPEHTQIDIEMSFVTQDEVFAVTEGLFFEIFKDTLGIELTIPFPRIPYKEAMDRFGIDKPDIRFGLELTDATEFARAMDFQVFHSVLDGGGLVKALVVPAAANLSRKDIQTWESDIKTYFKAQGLAWIRLEEQETKGSIGKFVNPAAREILEKSMGASSGDWVLFVAGKAKVVYQSLADLRLKTARRLNMIPEGEFKFAWITDFPLFEWDDDTNKWEAAHHLFSMPQLQDIELLETDPGRVHGQLYDLVLNGVELASGSIRIHNRALQERIFNVVGITPESAERRFGFFMKALEYGAPPHGGIAPGLDRVLMLMTGESTIRDVIAFPKTLNAYSPLDSSPSPVEQEQLKEVHIAILPPKKNEENSSNQAKEMIE